MDVSPQELRRGWWCVALVHCLEFGGYGSMSMKNSEDWRGVWRKGGHRMETGCLVRSTRTTLWYRTETIALTYDPEVYIIHYMCKTSVRVHLIVISLLEMVEKAEGHGSPE